MATALRIYPRMANICVSDAHRSPGRSVILSSYFSEGKQSRYGYHASQLEELHNLPSNLAIKLSAMFNQWLDELKELKQELPQNVTKRLTSCTQSYSTLAGRPSRCKHKLCPWCRAILTESLDRRLASSGARGCIVTDIPVYDSIPHVYRAHGALLSVKNVVFVGKEGYALRIARFFRIKDDDMQSAGDIKIADVLKYDYRIILNRVARTNWMEITKGMNFFTGPRSTKSLPT